MQNKAVFVLFLGVIIAIAGAIVVTSNEESEAASVGNIGSKTINEGDTFDQYVGYVPSGSTFTKKGQWASWATLSIEAGNAIYIRGTPGANDVGMHSFTFSFGDSDTILRVYNLEVLFKATFHNSNGSTQDRYFSVYTPAAMPSGTTTQFCGWNTASDGSGISYLQGSVRPILVRDLYEQTSTSPLTITLNYTSIGSNTNNISSVKVISGQEVMLPITQRKGTASAFSAQYAWQISAVEHPITDTATFTTSMTIQELDASSKSGLTFIQTNYTGYYVPTGSQFSLCIASCDEVAFSMCNSQTVHEGSLLTATGNRMNITARPTGSNAASIAIMYDRNGGSGMMPPQTILMQGSTVNPTQVDQCTFIPPAGKTFSGWRLGSTTGPLYSPGDTLSRDLPVVLYAIWSDLLKWSITFTPGDGTGSILSESVIRGDPFTMINSPFTAPDQRSFVGWMMSGTDTIYRPGDSITPTSDIIFIAMWKWDYYLVNLDPNGAPGISETIRINNVATYIIPTSPYTWTDHEFRGWKIGNAGLTLTAGSTYLLEGNIDLFAQWAAAGSPPDDPPDPTDPTNPGEDDDGNNSDDAEDNDTLIYVFALLVVAIIVAIIILAWRSGE